MTNVGERRGLRRGVVGVAVCDGRFLVIRRSRFVEAPGAYCFPGGAIEPGETEEMALKREFQEELSAQVWPVRPLWRSLTSWEVELAWWLVELRADAVLTNLAREVESFHWLMPEEMRELPQLLESNRHFLDAGSAGEFAIDGVTFSGK